MLFVCALFAVVTPVVMQSCATIKNPGFNLDYAKVPSIGYFDPNPLNGWKKLTNPGRVVAVVDGNIPWGGLHSNEGHLFVSLQATGATIYQDIQVTSGKKYNLNFLTAERPGYTNEELLTVKIGDDTILKDYSPPNIFTEKSVQFTAKSNTIRLQFINTSPAGDRSVFVDKVSICEVPPTTVTTITTTTTATETTHTYLNQIDKQFAALTQITNNLLTQMESLESRLTSVESKVQDVPNLIQDAQDTVSARIDKMAAALANSVSALPLPKSPDNIPACLGCSPYVEANGQDLSVIARGGAVTIETDTCGAVEFCDILQALATFRQFTDI